MVTHIVNYSRNGVSDWLLQRATAWVLTVYTIVVVGYLATQSGMNYEAWHIFMSQTWMQVFTILALASVCAHAWIGMWTVGTDYIQVHLAGDGANAVRKIYQLVCVMITIVYFIWGVKILWG